MKKVSSRQKPATEKDSSRIWVLVIMAICASWFAAMVAASIWGLEHKNPVRIENWRPEPADR